MRRGGNTLPALPGGTLYCTVHAAIFFRFIVLIGAGRMRRGGTPSLHYQE
jgi:hypothetical protein